LVHNPFGTNIYKQYKNSDYPSPFSHRHLSNAAEDSKGNVWFGYNRNYSVLKWVNNLQKFEEYPINNLLSNFKGSGGITNLYIDSKDNLWIAMNGMALLQYNIATKKGKYYDMNDGLPTESISGLCEDGSGRLWVTTYKGLSCFLPDKEKFTTFTISDGLPEDKFPGEGIFYDRDDNLLYVGAETSLAWFNPDSLLQKATRDLPPVFVDEIFVNGKKYYFDTYKSIHLKSNENNIEFSIATPDFFRNDQLVFQYFLTGSDWVDLGKNRNVTFNNLKPGKYTFSVRCKYNGSNEWKETEAPFTFTIATPWNKSWWFYSILAVLILGFALWLNRAYYLRKLEKQKAIVQQQKAIEQERNRIAADMHDDLGSGLTRINYATQIAMAKQPTKDDLMHIKNISTGLVENMREIIWAMKDENNNAEELLFYIKNYAVTYCTEHGLQIEVNMPDINDTITINGQNRRNIYLAIKETLHNVVKHAQATKVILNASINDDCIIEIIDNGNGNVAIEGKAGNGLQNIQKRILAVGGKAVFENLNNGFAVKMILPM
jgi:signal transduction histidine kinase